MGRGSNTVQAQQAQQLIFGPRTGIGPQPLPAEAQAQFDDYRFQQTPVGQMITSFQDDTHEGLRKIIPWFGIHGFDSAEAEQLFAPILAASLADPEPMYDRLEKLGQVLGMAVTLDRQQFRDRYQQQLTDDLQERILTVWDSPGRSILYLLQGDQTLLASAAHEAQSWFPEDEAGWQQLFGKTTYLSLHEQWGDLEALLNEQQSYLLARKVLDEPVPLNLTQLLIFVNDRLRKATSERSTSHR